MVEEIKALSLCVKAIEKLPDGQPRERIVSYLVARYTADGRATIRLAAELANALGDVDRARVVRHKILGDLLDMPVGPVDDGNEKAIEREGENET